MAHVKTNTYEPEKEIKAFLYQQVQELEPYVNEVGGLAVFVDQIQTGEATRYGVTFVLAPKSMNLRIRVENESLIEACVQAKEQALKQVNSVINEIFENPERDLALDAIRGNRFLH